MPVLKSIVRDINGQKSKTDEKQNPAEQRIRCAADDEYQASGFAGRQVRVPTIRAIPK